MVRMAPSVLVVTMRMAFSATDAEIAKAMERESETANVTVNGPTKVNSFVQNEPNLFL